MSQFTFMFLLVILWPIPIVLATIFYIQKRQFQQKLDAIKQIINDAEEELKESKSSETQSHYLCEYDEDGSVVYHNLQK